MAGTCASLLDFDDYHEFSEVHPGPTVAPAALFAGAAADVSLETTLTAFAMGAEVALRVGSAVAPGHYEAGWHATATCGAFGAATAAAVALQLDAGGVLAALGLVLGRTAGTRAAFGTDLKPLHAGSAAESGLCAALLAAAGFKGPAEPLFDPIGFAPTHSKTQMPERLLDGLGERWLLAEVGIKAYPCGIVTHGAVSAAVRLAPVIADLEAVDSVVVTLAPHSANVDRPTPDTPVAARMSIQHCVAATLASGDCSLEQFTPGALDDPRIGVLRRHVILNTDPVLTYGAGRVAVHLRDGSEHIMYEEQPPGSPHRPLGEEQLRNKVEALGTRVLSPQIIESLLAAVTSERGSAHDVLTLLAPSGASKPAG
jgi:2-methylcitrate dehydratase PrpD